MGNKTLKVKPWGDGQGEYVIIDADSFDEGLHVLIESQDGLKNLISREALNAALSALPGDQVDPDYVVSGMRGHFGDLFTQEDEDRVRELVKAPVKKPSHGLRIDDIKTRLTEKGIEFNPEAERGDLAKLLDDSQE
ncbi:hypothetical protein K5D33_07345 [Pseudomonas cichorii]|nr:hypothetical protein [Pseudomonas cichorii]MBX8534538.1 hypothetical protein [Pseudomonas cichorii]